MKALAQIITAADALAKRGVYAPTDESLTWAAKTVNYYTRVMWTATLDLARGDIDGRGFEDVMIALIEGQMRRAWNEGMRNVGLDPAKDFTAEMDAQLQEIILFEFEFVNRYIDDVLSVVASGGDVSQFRARVDMWANRYIDVVNRSEIFCKPNDLFQWRLGATEKHCVDCAGYAGRIMTGREWAQEKQPQSRALACSGYNCDCTLVQVVRT